MASLLGGKYKLYKNTAIFHGNDQAFDAFSNATFDSEFDLMIPQITGESPSESTLYNGIVMNETMIGQLGTYAEDWQTMSVIYWVESGADPYNGDVPVNSIRTMFPYAKKFENGSWFITADNIDFVWWISDWSDHTESGAFNKRTGGGTSDIIVPYVECINAAYNDKTVRNVLPFVNSTGTDQLPGAAKVFSSTGYEATAVQNNKWWWGPIFDHYMNVNFYSIMSWDYEPPDAPEDDPYEPGGYSGGDTGGDGTFDFEGNPNPYIGPPNLPTGLDCGFVTLYNPSTAELQQLSSYIWSNNFDLNVLKKLFNNPMDLFLNFGIVPVAVPDGGRKEVGIGLISTGVFMNTAASRYIVKDMGTTFISPYYGAYLDYSPYLRGDLILPYVGVIPIDIDAIMGKWLQVLYTIDILTGSCIAGINVSKDGIQANAHCIGTYAGNAMLPMPLTGADYSGMLGSLIQTAGAIAAGVATGGGAGAVAGGLAAASSAIVNEGKPMIQKGGALSAAPGFLGKQSPTLILSIPHQCLPQSQITEIGYPAYRTRFIKDCKGFFKVSEIHLKNIPATSSELDEIEQLLKEGVYR